MLRFARITLAAGATALLLSSCASMDRGTALRCGAFALGGAALGAALDGKKGAGKGALAGLAACAVVEIASRQTKSKDEVETDYRNNNGKLPSKAEVLAYQTTLNPNPVLKRGDALKVQSIIRVVEGTSEPVREVKEVLIAYAPSGEEFKRGEKKANAAEGSGEFLNTFTLRLPDGAPEGQYTIETKLMINGREVSAQPQRIQLAAVQTESDRYALR